MWAHACVTVRMLSAHNLCTWLINTPQMQQQQLITYRNIVMSGQIFERFAWEGDGQMSWSFSCFLFSMLFTTIIILQPSWECRILKCLPKGQNDRHNLCAPTCHQHVRQCQWHVLKTCRPRTPNVRLTCHWLTCHWLTCWLMLAIHSASGRQMMDNKGGTRMEREWWWRQGYTQQSNIRQARHTTIKY
jgi:hypothetical protein